MLLGSGLEIMLHALEKAKSDGVSVPPFVEALDNKVLRNLIKTAKTVHETHKTVHQTAKTGLETAGNTVYTRVHGVKLYVHKQPIPPPP